MNIFNQETAAEVMNRAFPAFITELNLKLEEFEEGRVVIRLPFSPSTSRVGGVISGQALAALADTTMVCSLWAGFGEQKPLATIDLHVTYLRAAKAEDLLAVAEVVKTGRTISFAKVSIFSATDKGKPVATAIGTFATAVA
jgi:uncharacterized protein (TIGR00369 family)